MADEFKITEQIMEDAETYIPIATKAYIASEMARACVHPTSMIHPSGEDDEEEFFTQSAKTYCESTSSKARIMMTILLTIYLKIWPEETPFLCDLKAYDEWGKAHVLNQLERFKAGKYREKAFDILSDYREMEKYLNSAIYAVLREKNDTVQRLMAYMRDMASTDVMENAVENVLLAQKSLEEEKARQEAIIHGVPEESGEAVGG